MRLQLDALKFWNYNDGQKSWDSWTVRTLFNTREIVPTSSPYPTDSIETVKAQFLWSFNIVLGGEGRGDMDL